MFQFFNESFRDGFVLMWASLGISLCLALWAATRCKPVALRVCRTHGRDTFLCSAKDKFVWNKFGRTKCARRARARTGAKQQYPKERPPGCRLNPALLRKPSLVSALRASVPLFKFAPGEFVAFSWGRQKGLPCPSGDARNPFRAPSGYSSRKLRCSARQTGFETNPKTAFPGSKAL